MVKSGTDGVLAAAASASHDLSMLATGSAYVIYTQYKTVSSGFAKCDAGQS